MKIFYRISDKLWGKINKQTWSIDLLVNIDDSISSKSSFLQLLRIQGCDIGKKDTLVHFNEYFVIVNVVLSKIQKRHIRNYSKYVVKEYENKIKKKLLDVIVDSQSTIKNIIEAIQDNIHMDEYAIWIYNEYTKHYTLFQSSFDLNEYGCFEKTNISSLAKLFIKSKHGNNFYNSVGEAKIKYFDKYRSINLIRYNLSEHKVTYSTEFVLCFFSTYKNHTLSNQIVSDICETLHLKIAQYYLPYIDRWKEVNRQIYDQYNPGKINEFYDICVKSIVNCLGWEAATIFSPTEKGLELLSTHNNLNISPSHHVVYPYSATSLTVKVSKGEICFSYDISKDMCNSHIYDEPTKNKPLNWVALPIRTNGLSAAVLRVKNKVLENTVIPFTSIDVEILKNVAKTLEFSLKLERAFNEEMKCKQEQIRNKQKDYDEIYRTMKSFRHEIRSPLTVLTQAPDLLILELKRHGVISSRNELPRSIKNIVTDVKSTGDRLRFLSHALSLEPSTMIDSISMCVLYRDIVAPVLSFSKLRAAKKNKIIYESRKTITVLRPVKAHAFTASMAFHAVIDNAIKYSKKKSPIEIYGRQGYSHSIIIVKSYGLPIHEHEIDRIFSKYYRGEEPVSNKIDGDGIGLNLCMDIMRQFGGDVRLVNFNNPVCFELRFPVFREG